MEALQEIWRDLLGRGQIAETDNFFECGGHSVAAARLAARVRAQLGRDLRISAIFASPTLAGLRASVERAPEFTTRRPTARSTTPGILSATQRRQWFLERMADGAGSFNIPLTVRLHGPLRPAFLAAAIRDVVMRHEVLRARYPLIDGSPCQVIESADDFEMAMLRLRPVEVDPWLSEEASRPFDLEHEISFRATLLRIDSEEHVLAMVVHHIAADGWSRSLILNDLSACYAFHCGRGPVPAQVRAQYREVAEAAQPSPSAAWWSNHLDGACTEATFPPDFPRPATIGQLGETVAGELGEHATAAVRRLTREIGCTPYTVFMAALQLMLSEACGQNDFVVATSVAGRDGLETEEVVGCFINTVAIRADLDRNRSVPDILRHVSEETLAAMEHADAGFDQVVRAIGGERQPGYRPLFQVMLTVHNEPAVSPVFPGLTAEWLEISNGGAKCDVFLAVAESESGWDAWLTCRSDLYHPATARELLQRYRRQIIEMGVSV